MQKRYVAFQITSPETAEIAVNIRPDLADKDFTSELEGQYLVLGFPRSGQSSLVLPALFGKNFSREDNSEMVVLHEYVWQETNRDPLRKTYVQKED